MSLTLEEPIERATLPGDAGPDTRTASDHPAAAPPDRSPVDVVAAISGPASAVDGATAADDAVGAAAAAGTADDLAANDAAYDAVGGDTRTAEPDRSSLDSQGPEGAGATPPAPPRRSRRWRRGLAVFLAVLGLLIVAAAVLVVVRYLPAYNDAKALRSDIETIVKRVTAGGLDIDRATLAGVRADLDTASHRLVGLDSLLRDDPLVGLARTFPATRDAVAGADAVAAAGDALLDAVTVGLGLGDHFVTIREQHASGTSGDSTLAALVALMATSRVDADRILGDLRRARTDLAAVPSGVPSVLADARDAMLSRIDAYEPLLATYTGLDDTLPAILGWDHPVRYLILTQDPAELRPSGGIIGSYGIVAFDKGRITDLTFNGTDQLDEGHPYPFITAPDALTGYLLGSNQGWQVTDGNWSPDFPTSAQDTLRLYTNESGDAKIDGVFAITTETVDELLRITGPVAVAGYDVTIGPGETTLKILQNTRSADAGTDRKAILGVFGAQLITKLLGLPPKDWAALAGDADTFRSQRLLQAWFKDPAAQALVAAHGFDGAVRLDEGDYVYPVDANVAPVSKLNLVTTRSMQLDVKLDEVGNANSTLALSWDNAIDTPAGAPLRAMSANVGSLDDLGLFERVVVPELSRLDSVGGGSYQELTGPAMDEDTLGRHLFGNYLRVPPGSTTLTYAWTAPYVADLTEATDGSPNGGTYHLVIQKQPGLRGGSLALTITVPDGMTITSASTGLAVSGATATLHLAAMDRDVEATVTFAGTSPQP